MSWALLSLGILEALVAINAHRPLRSPTWLSIFSFFAGWLVTELAVWHLVVVVPLAVALAERRGAELITLVPARTDTRWWKVLSPRVWCAWRAAIWCSIPALFQNRESPISTS